ncbi:aspartate/glutamate racemase family protein [Marinomonas sp. GJ51-6]|uniref:aspartate/glutamate racemase family protein n=1 Tax=Marinomonas sp. GJ51-6 TaxID=2992802 RepID=UPI0029343B42|nr:aspartate/glutamate racemase family protein [Marinomonas sp. GJ51-6]WOD07653.1 aspartate/glutamate racemase family protein [Marinomonas sp. GJ51-6]
MESHTVCTPRQILIINPNSNQEVTKRIQKAADSILESDCEALVLNPSQSPNAIETLAHRKIAEPLALDLLTQHQGYDGYVMACFDDIAIKASRRFLKVPVVDTVEASISLARLYESRFTIVTTVEAMVLRHSFFDK